MPWSVGDVDRHKKGLSDKQKETWVKVANDALKRCEDKGGSDCEGSAIRQANSLFEEAETKTVDGEQFPASDFLVVEDPDKVDTWHLQVKRHGTPDHNLMGGAKAALTSPGGYRGNVYEGPDKQAAVKKLKALYKAEDMEWSAEEAEPEPGGPERCVCPDCGHTIPKERGVPCRSVECPECGAKMVADVGEMAVVTHLQHLLSGALAEFQGSVDEFTSRVRGGFYNRFSRRTVAMPTESDMWIRDVLMDDPTFGDAVIVDAGGTLYVVAYEEDGDEIAFTDQSEWQEVVLAYKPVTESIGESLAERASGHAVALVESEDGKGPLYVDLIPVHPGWGNKRDNHYYTAEAVKGAAEIWKGAKMYATDHKQEEKSVLTEVSQVIESPVSYTDDGVPIVRAAIINPLFADVIRMRQDAGILEDLDCSIVARGLVEKDEFENDGRVGHRVTEILADDAGIDWVTRAGAGGHALPLTEADEAAQEDDVPKEDKEKAIETEERDLHEGDEDEAQDTEKATDDEQPTGEAQDGEPSPLTEARIAEILAETDLSEQAQEVLARATYDDEDALEAAIKALQEVVKAAAKSGQPFGMGGEPSQPEQSLKELEIARHKRFNANLRKHGRPELPLPAALRD